MYDKTNLIDYITAGTVSASMTVASAEEETTTTTTTTSSTSSTSATTPVVTDEYNFVFRDTDFDIDAGSLTYNNYTDYTYPGLQIQGITTGNTLVFTTKTSVASGIYLPTLYARAYGGRAKFDVYINDTLVTSALDTSTSIKGTGSHMPFELPQVTFNTDTVVTIKFVAVSSGTFYPDDITFKKIGEVGPASLEISMVAGAGARLASTNAISGIRFKAQVDADALDAYVQAGYTITLGTLIAPADYVDGDATKLTFDLEANRYLDVQATYGYYFDDQNGIIAGSIVNVKETNMGRAFVGRAYVTLTKDGESTTIYADVNDNARSTKALANAIISNGTYDNYTTEIQAVLDKWSKANDWA